MFAPVFHAPVRQSAPSQCGGGQSICDGSSDDEPPENCTRSSKVATTPLKHDHREEKEWKDASRPVAEAPKYNPSGCNGVFGTEIKANVSFSWVNPKLKPLMCETGSGLYAIQDVKKDDHLVVWSGKILDAEQALFIMDTDDRHYILQISACHYQIPLSKEREAADWTNHSCEPNAGFGKGSPVCLAAMRDIKAGEQICFDYGMCETDPRLWDPMDCLCGTPSCRGKITANDWKLPYLHKKYEGFWSPHVKLLIEEELHASGKCECQIGTAAAAVADKAVATVTTATEVDKKVEERRVEIAPVATTTTTAPAAAATAGAAVFEASVGTGAEVKADESKIIAVVDKEASATAADKEATASATSVALSGQPAEIALAETVPAPLPKSMPKKRTKGNRGGFRRARSVRPAH